MRAPHFASDCPGKWETFAIFLWFYFFFFFMLVVGATQVAQTPKEQRDGGGATFMAPESLLNCSEDHLTDAML